MIILKPLLVSHVLEDLLALTGRRPEVDVVQEAEQGAADVVGEQLVTQQVEQLGNTQYTLTQRLGKLTASLWWKVM